MPKRIEAFALAFLLWASGAAAPTGAETRAETATPDDAPSVRAMFLNVGKADAALFFIGDKRYLIDTGTKDSTDAMLRALSYYDVTTLDGVILTHTDKDHVGGLKALLKSDIAVGTLYAPTFSVLDNGEHPVVKLADKYDKTLVRLNAGDVIEAGDRARFTTLGPLTQDDADENNNSLVLRLETPNGDMLLAGDMEIAEENELLAAGVIGSAAVLKVGHHGADDASNATFIYTLRPQLAVISTDPGEEKDTPSSKVIRRLWDVGAEVYVTNQATCCVEVTLERGNASGKLFNYLVE
ncbi:MAG: MBL fold metallo-hydrolase [Eubacteriales bacterium]|nr:MBL fold metallo-hydrolase [Eubacteriales bacterium]